jgi:hypothetical protein
VLSLGGNRAIGDAGVEAVAARLIDCGLDLSAVGLGDDGCRTLVQGILGSCVRQVYVTGNFVGREGDETLRVVCAIQDELCVTGDHDRFSRDLQMGPRCSADVVVWLDFADVIVVADIVFLSGILPWLVALPVLLYSGQ